MTKKTVRGMRPAGLIIDEVKMSYSDYYEINPATENVEEDVTEPEPPSYQYPIIDSFEESLLATRLVELCPTPPKKEGEIVYAMSRDDLEMIPDYAQPFIGALLGIGDVVDEEVNGRMLDVTEYMDIIKHFLGIHTLIAIYIAKIYKLDLNAVIEQSMTRIEHEAAEDRKIQAALNDMNMTHGGSITPRSATEDSWPDALF